MPVNLSESTKHFVHWLELFDVFTCMWARCDFIYTGVQEKWLNDLQMNKYLFINYTKKNVQSFEKASFISVPLRLSGVRKSERGRQNTGPSQRKREKNSLTFVSLSHVNFGNNSHTHKNGIHGKLPGLKVARTQSNSSGINEHNINTFGTSCTRPILTSCAQIYGVKLNANRENERKRTYAVNWNSTFTKENGNWRILNQQLHFFCSLCVCAFFWCNVWDLCADWGFANLSVSIFYFDLLIKTKLATVCFVCTFPSTGFRLPFLFSISFLFLSFNSHFQLLSSSKVPRLLVVLLNLFFVASWS